MTGGPHAVTGAFSYSGAAVARALAARGRVVRTLTNHPERAPLDTTVQIAPLDFADGRRLREALAGVEVLYNTYWIRFPHAGATFDQAVENSARLFAAARAAGVRRVVHISITHPNRDSPYPYFRGKAAVEDLLRASGLSYAIARPAILFGGDGVLINNVAWLLRRFPVIALGAGGHYRVRGIHVDDLAGLCADLGERVDDVTMDAVGPDSLSFRDLVAAIRSAVGSTARMINVPGPVMVAATTVLGWALRDRLLTADEYGALAAGLADSTAPATGSTSITDWIARQGSNLGVRYANEIERHFATTA
jgi:NADH dehydrogenase